jgi:hypothetical protein
MYTKRREAEDSTGADLGAMGTIPREREREREAALGTTSKEREGAL